MSHSITVPWSISYKNWNSPDIVTWLLHFKMCSDVISLRKLLGPAPVQRIQTPFYPPPNCTICTTLWMDKNMELLSVLVRIITPRRACAARLQYLVRPSVLPSVFYHTMRDDSAQKRYQWVQCHTSLILKTVIFVNLLRSKVMEWKPSQQANMLMSMAYRNQILPVLSTMEAVEVTLRLSMWFWFAKNTTYQRS